MTMSGPPGYPSSLPLSLSERVRRLIRVTTRRPKPSATPSTHSRMSHSSGWFPRHPAVLIRTDLASMLSTDDAGVTVDKNG